jgi:hypothetical protein
MVKKVGLLVLLLGLSEMAAAGEACKTEYFLWFPIEVCSHGGWGGGETGGRGSSTHAAPELDPGSLMSGLTLLAGGLTILRARRRKDTDG